MSRFYVPKDSIKGDLITIKGSQAHHILDVMRLKKLDKVVTFNGTGNEYIGFISDTKASSLTVEIVERRAPKGKSRCVITLIQAIPKKEKMDHIVEKAVELGVYSIAPVFTGRTIPSWDESKRIDQVERWRRIATEASKQCGRSDIPHVSEITGFEDSLKNADEYDLGLIAALSGETVPLKAAIKDFKAGAVALAIGPEGDFMPAEIARAKEAGFKLISLGPRVLKSDTAALAALSILGYEFE